MASTGVTKFDGIKLDDRDIKMLTILQREGRIAKAALAERVNLSATPCWERLRRLEDAGIIESYEAKVSLKAFGPVTMVFVQIELESHRSEDFVRFENAITALPEMVECWAVGGGIDYVCKLVVPHLEDYQRLMDDLLSREIGIKRYYSFVVTAPVKDAPLPVERLAARHG
ncbi:MAG TPA: Lrp/AsnC family transcriptional regulator [Devosiaceae bacterium]|jgi:Lrp/AsnC family transcriptional regulator of ectoine degradation|nr:Lrp/AsnC family transcriptional regulator [Devosiaceae bacterium]